MASKAAISRCDVTGAEQLITYHCGASALEFSMQFMRTVEQAAPGWSGLPPADSSQMPCCTSRTMPSLSDRPLNLTHPATRAPLFASGCLYRLHRSRNELRCCDGSELQRNTIAPSRNFLTALGFFLVPTTEHATSASPSPMLVTDLRRTGNTRPARISSSTSFDSDAVASSNMNGRKCPLYLDTTAASLSDSTPNSTGTVSVLRANGHFGCHAHVFNRYLVRHIESWN